MLESLCHGDNAFVTLTYRDDSLPPGGSLNPLHVQRWLKRLRRDIAPQTVRFFAVGEYGTQTNRPHYHAALFGYPACFRFPFGDRMSVFQRSKCDCYPCKTLRDSWGLGKTDCGLLSKESAQYVAGYVTKKMTSPTDSRLEGRHPEFSRMSLRPGIGAPFLPQVLDSITLGDGVKFLELNQDVPSQLQHGSRLWPMGRYLTQTLRKKYGFKEKGAPKEVLAELAKEMLDLFKTARQAPEAVNWSQARILTELNKGKIANLESKANLYKKVGTL